MTSAWTEVNHPPINPPTTLAEVEELVKRLYLPGSPVVITAIDDQLKLLQNSPEGWQLGDGLLRSDDRNVRFFGALTLQVKLNNDGARLDAEAAQTVLMRLLSWTAQLNRAGESSLVLLKLVASLTTYFIRSPVPWDKPLLHLAVSLQQGDSVSQDRIPDTPEAILQILPLLSEPQLITLVWLSSGLATEVGKIDNVNPASAAIHDRMIEAVDDASQTMQFISQRPPPPAPSQLKKENLTCFLNWVNYAQPLWTASNQESLGCLRRLVDSLAIHLSDESSPQDAMEVFRDILESFTSFFLPQHMEALSSIMYQSVRPKMLQGLRDMQPEVLPVAQLVIAYGIANIQEVVEQPHHLYGSKTIVDLLLAILEAPGYPGDEDELSFHSIEFWNTYIEYVNEAIHSNSTEQPDPPWLEIDKDVCMRLTRLLWSKMRTPPSDVAQEWTEAESEGFREFRMDASDLMLSLFIRLGNGMLQQFITLVLDSLRTGEWLELEAALFCINSLADNVLEDQHSEELLVQLFGSPLFQEIANFEQPIPSQARRTAIDTLGTYGAYIERHAEFLPDTLRFLFASLETTGFHISAAKSIDELCSTCRSSLTGELDGFIAQYNRFAQSKTSEPYTNERVIGAIAAIIQAVSPESARVSPFSALLDIVETMVPLATRHSAQGQHELAHEVGVSAVECLGRIGKGMQAPDDLPIDLYNDRQKGQDDFWVGETGRAIQHRILKICYNVLQLFPASGEVVDAVCGVFRTGFTETEPGPFVFPPDMSIGFLEQCSVNTPHVESVLSMIMKLLVQHSRQSSLRIDDAVSKIYEKTVSFIREIGHPSRDPSIAQSCIDIFFRMVPLYLHILLDIASSGAIVQHVLDFALAAIDSAELMPKRAAAEFWVAMAKPPDASANDAVRTRCDQVLAAYGPSLCQALVNQITGRAQRSEVDQLCEPLKMLVSKRPQTKSWLEAALFNSNALPTNISPSVGEAEKTRFIQQIMGLRGGNKTKDVVKIFWAACRGTVNQF